MPYHANAITTSAATSREHPAVTRLFLPRATHVPGTLAFGCYCARAASRFRSAEDTARPLARSARTPDVALAHARCKSGRSAGARFGAKERARPANCAIGGLSCVRSSPGFAGSRAGDLRVWPRHLPPPCGLRPLKALVLFGLWCLWAFESYFIMEDAIPGVS